MLAAPKVVVLFLAGMAAETGLGGFFRRLGLERDDFLWITFLEMSFARTVTLLATGDFSFPTTDGSELCVSSVGKVLELIFVTVLAGFTSNVVPAYVNGRGRLVQFDRLGGTIGGKPHESGSQETTNEQGLDV